MSRRRREQAMHMRLDFVESPSDWFDDRGDWRGASTRLSVVNETGETVTSIVVEVERDDGTVEYVCEERERLPSEAAFTALLSTGDLDRVRVGWTDSDGIRWAWRRAGTAPVLERMKSAALAGMPRRIGSTWSSRRAAGWPDCWE